MSSPFPPRQALQPQDLTSGRNRGDTSPGGGYEKTLSPDPDPVDRRWRAIGDTVRGASHVRKGMVNQDAIGWWPGDGVVDHVALAVADGHGSPKNFRSNTGSEFAKKVSLGLAAEIVGAGSPSLSDVKISLQSVIPRRIVKDWLALVHADLDKSPLTERELAAVEAQAGRKGRDLVAESPHLAYGSTLVTVLATKTFVAFWQIGDGDVLTVSGHGNVDRPVAGDEELIANETTSLCSPEAWRLFRTAILGTPAPMIMLSTDGFANSFLSEEGFFKFGTDVFRMAAAEGIEAVGSKLNGWLTEMTRQGSGDDISLGIICQPDALRRVPAEPPPAATVVDTGPKTSGEYPASWPTSPSPGLDDSTSTTAPPRDQDGSMPSHGPGPAPAPPPEPGPRTVPHPGPVLREGPPPPPQPEPVLRDPLPPRQEPARPMSPPAATEPEAGHRPPSSITSASELERPVSPPTPPADPVDLAGEGATRRLETDAIPQADAPDEPLPDADAPEPEAQAPSGSRLSRLLRRTKKHGTQDDKHGTQGDAEPGPAE